MPDAIVAFLIGLLFTLFLIYFGYQMGKSDKYENGIQKAKELIKESRQADEQHTKGE